MDQTFKTPVQIFINGKFFCIAQTVEVRRNSYLFRKSLIPDNIKMDPSQFTGIVMNIKKEMPSKKEKAEVEKNLKDEAYDEFYKRMVKAVNDPRAHRPVDIN